MPKYMARAARETAQPPAFQREEGAMSTLVKALIGLAAYLVVGIVGFSLLKEELRGTSTSTFVDALYFAVVTMTTVGYGDLVPQGVVAKLFTCAFVFVGCGLVGVLVSGAANYLVEKQENILMKKYKKKISEDEDPVDEDEVVAARLKAAISGIAVAVLVVTGVLVLMFCEGLRFIDAFYCVCVTVTTLGYGDESFNTMAGRLFAVFWILTSTVCVAQFFLYLAESHTEERQRRLAVWALTRPTTTSDLEAADLDDDGTVR
jgi:potassium channel subfamily K